MERLSVPALLCEAASTARLESNETRYAPNARNFHAAISTNQFSFEDFLPSSCSRTQTGYVESYLSILDTQIDPRTYDTRFRSPCGAMPVRDFRRRIQKSIQNLRSVHAMLGRSLWNVIHRESKDDGLVGHSWLHETLPVPHPRH